ncbi:helix-turn-helix domain-containing protein [Nocardioides pinisoli]|uniref:Helix-turn-helix domain containing protein n=1 Tax=Nocardioides pinisoli TaxID=2950279 RepID=A0ABT1L0H5_9ACTN|nr:helix-turn-helix domain-containing protein [Nocardioides pinisoli]MCP3423541.1 helix-turn-helix domain containing protein [Nocardioides pinisoli]
MYSVLERSRAVELVSAGATLSAASRTMGIARSTIRSWVSSTPRVDPGCVVCRGAVPWPGSGYSALLGFYLGDGCVSSHGAHTTLRIACDTVLTGIVTDVSALVGSLQPGGVFTVSAPGTTVVQSNWKHWPCLFPQHGPGRKHERLIALEPWQTEMVIAFPGAFLRGLFHSDGARVNNWATRTVGGVKRRYDYPRWQFSNRSEDIIGLCCWALDLADVAWRRSGPWTVSVSRKEAVARLDALIGPKC